MSKKIVRIISDDSIEISNKNLNDIAKDAIFIPINESLDFNRSDEMKWDLIGRQIFNNNLKDIDKNNK